MKLATVSRRRWVVAGIAAGLLVGAGQIMSLGERRMGGPGFIDQRTFESELHRTPSPTDPQLVALSVTPGDPIDLVELTYSVSLTDGSVRTTHVQFAAPNPYVPLDHTQNGQATGRVADYLREVAGSSPIPPVGVHWLDGRPVLLLGLFVGAGLLVLGALIPASISLLKHTQKRPADVSGDIDRTEEDAPPSNGQVPAEQADVPVVPLSATPLEQSTPRPQLKKEYAGQFYPVEKQAPHGFSLVELLVVLGVIAILLAFLLPATRLARAQAQTAACASQLRQLGIALHAYANANQGSLPAWSGWHTWPPGQPDDESGPAWTIELIPYLGSPDSKLYNCPAWPGDVPRRNYFLEAQWAGRSGRHAMKLSEITLSGRFVLSGDKTNLALYPPPMGIGPLADDADPDDFGYGGALLWPWNGGFYMHRNGNNVLFDDGHVVLCPRYDPYSMTFNPHRMESWAQVTPN